MLKELERFITDGKGEGEGGSRHGEDPKMQQLIKRCRGLPFFKHISLYSKRELHDNTQFMKYDNHKNCCFNHIIGLPTKNGTPKPIFDYQDIIIKSLLIPAYSNSVPSNASITHSIKEKHYREKLKKLGIVEILHNEKVKHVAVLKASGLGITELILRFMCWLCLRNDDLKGSQMIIFTGPRIELAVSLINRMKDYFKTFGITFSDKETVLNLNGVRIEAFPSHHAATARGLPNPSLIFVDECSFIPDREANEVMDIMLRYVPKSDPYLIAVSTPNKPDDMMWNIMKEDFDKSPFKRLFLDWTYGVGKIYTQEEIDKIKNSRSFPREYCLQFTGLEGNVFSQQSIDNAVMLGRKYEPIRATPNVPTIIGLDPAFGSSKFGIVVSQYIDENIVITYCEELARPNFSDVIDKILELKRRYGRIDNIIVDNANPEIWQALKLQFRERCDEQYMRDKISWCKEHNQYLERYMMVVPKSFGIEGKQMLQHLSSLLDQGLLAIPSQFKNLINGLRSATADEWKLGKTTTAFDDLIDALRLNVSYYKFGK